MFSPPEIERVAEANLPTEYGPFRIVGFRERSTGEEFVVLVKGSLDPTMPILVRIHSKCLMGDVFHSNRCDCGRQLQQAIKLIEEEGSGVVIYQQQEGSGISLIDEIRSYGLEDVGAGTLDANISHLLDAEVRTYSCVEILKQLGGGPVRIMSNNPGKIEALRAQGAEILERVPIEVEPQDGARLFDTGSAARP